MLEDNEIYNSIVKEFQLNGPILEEMKEAVGTLTKARMNINKLFKIPKFMAETLDINEKELIRNIDTYKLNIKDYKKKQIELKDKIKINKKEVKAIKLHVNELEVTLRQEKQESRKLNEDLRIFFSREKFKFIKKLLVRKYTKVFLKYSSDLSIKSKIMESNKRKEKIREEKQNLNNTIENYNRKISINKIALAEMRKSIINMEKRIDFFTTKLQGLKEYKEMEKNFILKVQQYEKLNEKGQI